MFLSLFKNILSRNKTGSENYRLFITVNDFRHTWSQLKMTSTLIWTVENSPVFLPVPGVSCSFGRFILLLLRPATPLSCHFALFFPYRSISSGFLLSGNVEHNLQLQPHVTCSHYTTLCECLLLALLAIGSYTGLRWGCFSMHSLFCSSLVHNQ